MGLVINLLSLRSWFVTKFCKENAKMWARAPISGNNQTIQAAAYSSPLSVNSLNSDLMHGPWRCTVLSSVPPIDAMLLAHTH